MNNDISSLEEEKTWNVMVRKNFPEVVNFLPSIWALKIKRYPDGRFPKFEEIFSVRGYLQQGEVDYTGPYYPVVRKSIVRALFSLPMK